MSSDSRDISCYSSAKKIRDSSTALGMTMKGANPEMNLRCGGGFAALCQTPSRAISKEGVNLAPRVATVNPTHAQ